jgi:hypothetical protein
MFAKASYQLRSVGRGKEVGVSYVNNSPTQHMVGIDFVEVKATRSWARKDCCVTVFQSTRADQDGNTKTSWAYCGASSLTYGLRPAHQHLNCTPRHAHLDHMPQDIAEPVSTVENCLDKVGTVIISTGACCSVGRIVLRYLQKSNWKTMQIK